MEKNRQTHRHIDTDTDTHTHKQTDYSEMITYPRTWVVKMNTLTARQAH